MIGTQAQDIKHTSHERQADINAKHYYMEITSHLQYCQLQIMFSMYSLCIIICVTDQKL